MTNKEQSKQHERIYLQPVCEECVDPDEPRNWCEDGGVWDDVCDGCGKDMPEPSTYILAEKALEVKTCDGCGYWDKESWECSSRTDATINKPPPNFGCIHWEKNK